MSQASYRTALPRADCKIFTHFYNIYYIRIKKNKSVLLHKRAPCRIRTDDLSLEKMTMYFTCQKLKRYLIANICVYNTNTRRMLWTSWAKEAKENVRTLPKHFQILHHFCRMIKSAVTGLIPGFYLCINWGRQTSPEWTWWDSNPQTYCMQGSRSTNWSYRPLNT